MIVIESPSEILTTLPCKVAAFRPAKNDSKKVVITSFPFNKIGSLNSDKLLIASLIVEDMKFSNYLSIYPSNN